MPPTEIYARLMVEGQLRHARLERDQFQLLEGDPLSGPPSLAAAPPIARASARFAVPCAPSKILGVGLNYRAHALEMNKPLPDEPLFFLKPPSSLLAHGEAIVRPRGFERTDYEGELAVVIGRTARRVSAPRALDYVFGYTICNDVTVRDLQKKDVQYTRAKGFDSFCPLGPVIATGLDPRGLTLRTRQNGVVKQQSSTSDLIFSVAEVIAFASRVMTLFPGDVITTGTPPGVGPIAPGDEITIEIEGIGTLENSVVDEEPI